MGRQPDPTPDFTRWLDGVRDRMKAQRERCNLSYREAEQRTGVPFASIRRVEIGDMMPTVQLVYRLAAGYGVDVSDLLCEAKKSRNRA